uniref:Thioredoxin domain-containing protein n=1 Tax=Oryza meridionalis TaxID=40149 RepID=A0A0E0E4E7_9ORYZ
MALWPTTTFALRRTATFASHHLRKSLLVSAGKKEKMGKLVKEWSIHGSSRSTSSSAQPHATPLPAPVPSTAPDAVPASTVVSRSSSLMQDDACGPPSVNFAEIKSWSEEKPMRAEKKHKIVVIANFSAAWCGPCRVIAPVYAEMSQTYPQFMFLTVDVDQLMDFSLSWDIRATLIFYFVKNGQQVDKLVGANKPELEKKIY